MNDLVGIPEVALMLNKNRQTIWMWYKNGRLKASFVTQTESGRRPRPFFSRQDIEALAEAEKAAA